MNFLPTSLQTALTFLVILAILVFFHELGHFGVAKLFRMRVEEFALGFGKRLWRVGFDGQTEYNVRAIPLGGFVRIAGMEIEDAAERRLTGGDRRAAGSQTETTNIHLIEQEAAEVDGVDPDGFNSRPIYQRFLVILAGPVFSILLAWLAFSLIGVTYGLPAPDAKPTTQIGVVFPNDVAARAGLKAGDRIVSVENRPVADWESLVKTIRASAGKPLRLTVRHRDDQATRVVTVTPRSEREKGETVGKIGVAPTYPVRRVGLGASFAAGGRIMVGYVEMLGEVFQRGKAKEALGGPIAIFQGTRGAVEAGGSSKLELLAQLSFSIGLFNLLPIPILDGGHIALLTLEAIRGRKLTAEQTQRVLTTGLAIIALLFVWVMFNDISRLFRQG